MDYGILPGGPLERLALKMGTVPVPVLDALLPLVKARSILVAVELGIFEALRDEPLAAAELARRHGLDAEATGMLLRTLTASDYLEQRGDRYRLTRLARRSLLRGGAEELWGFTAWCGHLWGTIGRLEELLATGRGIDLHGTLERPADWALYQRAMLEIARFQAPVLARKLPLRRGARRLLDIAGGHGLFAAELVRRHPGLAAEVLELPAAVDAARELAREEGIGHLVEHRAGDLHTAELGDGELDLVLLSNILHHFGAEQNIALLRRIHRALAPGGNVAIWEIDVPDPQSPAQIGDLAALFFRLTSTAAAVSGDTCAAWLRQAGFAKVTLRRLVTLPGNVLVCGSK